MKKTMLIAGLLMGLVACNNNATTQPTERDHTTSDSGSTKRDTTRPDSILHRLPADSSR